MRTSIYDEIAQDYDAMWTKPEDLAENQQVVEILRPHFAEPPRTLDIGCGTGLFLDLGLTTPDRYTGIDPSGGMLAEFRRKHPQTANLHQMTAEEWLQGEPEPEPEPFELVVSLFGPVSYLEPWAIERLADLATSMVFLMNYDGKWLPDWYGGVEPPSVAPARKTSRALTERYPGEVITIGNFEVTLLDVREQ